MTDVPLTTRSLRLGYVLVPGLILAAGCYNQQQYDQLLEQSAALQAQLDQAKGAMKMRETELAELRDQATQLTSEQARAARTIESLTNEVAQSRRNLDAARRDLDSATRSLAREHAELEKTLAGQKEARVRMELELAQRDRTIDVLRSQVRRLERELAAACRAASAPSTEQAPP